MNSLTEMDKEILIFITDYTLLHGYAPSLREICAGVYRSKPTVQRHIMRLVESGYMYVTPKTARSYVVNIAI